MMRCVVSLLVVCLAVALPGSGTAGAGESAAARPQKRPNIVLVMADDLGWGQTGYYDHPVLKTPHLDEMAAAGLRFDRFYAGAPNCSPTRATVMTGRTNDRTGVTNHGVPMRPQEVTLPALLQQAGYRTGHFGKWHLNGLRGPGVPILKDDIRGPGPFGFETWLSVTNFFDMNPVMSRQGAFEEFEGDSSEIIVDEALQYMSEVANGEAPFFVVIWYGTPHSPFMAYDKDKHGFAELQSDSASHYGELVAMDRSIGTLRRGLRKLNVADDTLLWFCSDNGGLPKIQPETVGGLRGFKGSVYEGGLRVPCVMEWPRGIPQPRVTSYPACTVDILPTVLEVAGVSHSRPQIVLDGLSLKRLLTAEIPRRSRPIGFRHTSRLAMIDNEFKIVKPNGKSDRLELYNLADDPAETNDLSQSETQVFARLKARLQAWNASVDSSVLGRDYPEGKVVPPDPGPRQWAETDLYRAWYPQWKGRPEYRSRIR